MRDITVQFYDIAKSDILRCLFCGVAGTGKTWLLGTFPSPLVFDFDGGGKTLARKHIPFISYGMRGLRETDPKLKEEPYLEMRYGIGRMVINKGMVWLKALPNPEDGYSISFDQKEGYEPYQVKTLGIDSVSRMGEIFNTEVMLDGRVGQTDKHTGKRDPSLEGGVRADFYALGNRLIEIFDMCKDLPINVVATAGIDSDFTAEGGVSYSNLPDILGRFRKQCPHHFDIVALLEKDKLKPSTWHFKTTSLSFNVKTRGTFPPDIENPTYEKLLKAMEENNK